MPTEFAPALRAAGLRVTAGRLAVLRALQTEPHSTADAVHRIVRATDVATSVQSVHNVLADLTDAALLRRIEPARSAARYELRVDDNHHHIVCTSCGTVADVDCTVGDAPCLTPSHTAGFAITTAEVVFWGLCATCQSLPSSTNHSTTSKENHVG